jgi:hypothetical protein
MRPDPAQSGEPPTDPAASIPSLLEFEIVIVEDATITISNKMKFAQRSSLPNVPPLSSGRIRKRGRL